LTTTAESVLTKKQVKRFGPKPIDYYGIPATITAEVRYDDECGNGHNSFAITGTIRATDRRRVNPRDGGHLAGGCLHDEIAAKFPDLAPFIKWHLSSSDGPMHYIANTVYHASDRDYNATAWSEGKARDLNAARHSAVWPEATDEELTAPDLKAKLESRLPALLAAMQADVEALGFVW
jgi:hypothetical protein